MGFWSLDAAARRWLLRSCSGDLVNHKPGQTSPRRLTVSRLGIAAASHRLSVSPLIRRERRKICNNSGATRLNNHWRSEMSQRQMFAVRLATLAALALGLWFWTASAAL